MTTDKKKFSVPELVATSILNAARELTADLAVEVRESIENAIYSQLENLLGVMSKDEAMKTLQILASSLLPSLKPDLHTKLQEVVVHLTTCSAEEDYVDTKFSKLGPRDIYVIVSRLDEFETERCMRLDMFGSTYNAVVLTGPRAGRLLEEGEDEHVRRFSKQAVLI